MTYGPFYCVQLRTISASFTDTQQQTANRKIINQSIIYLFHKNISKSLQ